MLLFVDLDSTGEPGEVGREGASARLRTLLEGLGPYSELVEVVLSSPWVHGCGLEVLRAELGLDLPAEIVGNLSDDVPPLALSRYDHIIYWLTRRHVWRLPSWLAVLPGDQDWPADQHGRRIPWSNRGETASTSQALRTRLERYYWADLWWGDGPPPDAAARWRAHALMVAWSLPRRRWQHVLGHTTPEFVARLDLLLKVHAGAQRYVRAGVWYPHWVHLPRVELGMRRPIELIEALGVEGIEQVLAYVWQSEPATVSLPQGVASAGVVRPSNY